MKPDKKGYYGEFGGSIIPELLHSNIEELNIKSMKIINSKDFKTTLNHLLKTFVGRPSPLYKSIYLSEKYNAKIYLKREDLNHTGSHKINNALGQVLLAGELGKKNIIAETGAGQHGLAIATACAYLNYKCTIFMGQIDIARQLSNVEKMKLLGAEIIEVTTGSKTLKDATNEAIRYWINNSNETHYAIGSVVGPHPYPNIVTHFQSVISKEIKTQLKIQLNTKKPNYILACIGGGSNAVGAFYHFIRDKKVKLIAAEAAGIGINSTKTAASINRGSVGVFHGSKTYVLQNNDGQIIEPYSISAGLDYPGVGPIHAHLKKINRAQYFPINDKEALKSGMQLIKNEGIIPAIESAHALALLNKITFKPNDVVVICLSGRGEKDLKTYLEFNKKLK